MVKNKPGMRISSKLEPEELEQLDLSKFIKPQESTFHVMNSTKIQLK